MLLGFALRVSVHFPPNPRKYLMPTFHPQNQHCPKKGRQNHCRKNSLSHKLLREKTYVDLKIPFVLWGKLVIEGVAINLVAGIALINVLSGIFTAFCIREIRGFAESSLKKGLHARFEWGARPVSFVLLLPRKAAVAVVATL